MKKTYIFPQVKVVNIKVQNILAGSYTENTSGVPGMGSGSFGARQARFSDDDEWFEE